MTSDKLSHSPGFMTPEEVADALRVSEKTVKRLLWKGDLRGAKVGGQWRVSISDYNDYIRRAYPQPLEPEASR